MRQVARLIYLIFLIFMVSSCATGPHRESVGQYIDSATITTKVKANLANQLGAQAFKDISVTTYKNIVQLSGFVRSQGLKNKASIVASKVAGVARVENNLLIKA